MVLKQLYWHKTEEKCFKFWEKKNQHVTKIKSYTVWPDYKKKRIAKGEKLNEFVPGLGSSNIFLG